MAGILFFQKSGAKEAKEADKHEAGGAETVKRTHSAGGAEADLGEAWGKAACGARRTDGRQCGGAIWETDGAREKSGAAGATDSAVRDAARQADNTEHGGTRQYDGDGPLYDGAQDTDGAQMPMEIRTAYGTTENSEQGCGAAQAAESMGASDTVPGTSGSLPASAIFMLSPDDILPNPAQPRKMFTEEAILRLADSIRMHGIIQPLAVRRVTSGGKYELVAGERRLRAAKYLRLEKVPCFTVDADSEESAHLAIIENIQRENLNMFEQAQAIAGLMKLHCLTQEKIAARLSCSQSYVANKLRLLRIPAQDREDILESSLTERHVRALLRLRDEQQRRGAMHTVIRRHMNVAATEEYIDRLVEADKNRQREESAGRTAKLIIKDVRLLYNTIDRAVETVRLSGVNVETVRRECLGTTEIVIRIPKEA